MARRSVTIVASDGKREGISWYDGATEAAVMRCARVALGLPAKGTAHLVWKSGDIVDFGKPITDGVTLHLDTTVSPQGDVFGGGGGGGGGLYSYGVPSGVSGGRCVAQRRPSTGGANPGQGDGDEDQQLDWGRWWSPISSKKTHQKSTAKGKSTWQWLFRWAGGGGSDTRRNSDDERRPLLVVRSSTQAGAVVGGLSERGFDEASGGGEEEGDSPDQQRVAILKFKRILAHLANERTFLAWVRVTGKMFTAGVLSIKLGGSSSGVYSVCFVAVGMVYFALCPYVVFVGAIRFHKMAAVMQGSVHEAYDFFAGKLLFGLTMLMTVLSTLTVAVMVNQLLSVV